MARKPKIVKTPTLIPIDLSKSIVTGVRSTHPDFNEEDTFLAQIDGELYVGHFDKQWYGYNFDDGWGASGHQFDAPGTNLSRWQAVWRIKR